MRYVQGPQGWGAAHGGSAPTGAGRSDRRAGDEKAGPCPGCGGPGIPIVFGFPGDDLIEAEARGEVILGGCCLPSDPRCPVCNGPLSPEDPWASDDPSEASGLDGCWL